MTEDPWVPSITEKSADLGISQPPIVLKYPDFAQKRPAEKLDAFTDIQAENWGDPMEIILQKCGIDEGEYKNIIDNPDYMRELHRKCTDRRYGPRLAAIYEKVAEAAEAGDPVFAKMVMASDPAKGPESVTFVNAHIANMTDSELGKHLEHLQSELKALSDDK